MFLAVVFGRPAEIIIEQSFDAAETALRGGTSLLPAERPAKPNKLALLGVNDSILITVMGSWYAGRRISSLAERVNLLAKHVKDRIRHVCQRLHRARQILSTSEFCSEGLFQKWNTKKTPLSAAVAPFFLVLRGIRLRFENATFTMEN
jgi:hypothetical protein